MKVNTTNVVASTFTLHIAHIAVHTISFLFEVDMTSDLALGPRNHSRT